MDRWKWIEWGPSNISWVMLSIAGSCSSTSWPSQWLPLTKHPFWKAAIVRQQPSCITHICAEKLVGLLPKAVTGLRSTSASTHPTRNITFNNIKALLEMWMDVMVWNWLKDPCWKTKANWSPFQRYAYMLWTEMQCVKRTEEGNFLYSFPLYTLLIDHLESA